MANKSISQLTAGSAVSGTDLFPDVQTVNVGPVKVTATQLSTFFWYQPTLVAPSLGAATATSINIGGATLGSNALAVNGSAIFGTQQTTQGSIVLANTAAGAFTTTIQSSNSASAAWTFTLPTTAGTNGYLLTTNGSGVTSWTNPTALGIDLDIGTTAITNGTVGRLLYEGAGNVLQESANLTFSTAALTLGVQQTTLGSIVLANTAAGAFPVTLQSSNSTSAAWTMTLPTTAGTNTYLLTTDGAGNMSWTNPTTIGGLPGGSSGQIQYNNSSSFGGISAITTNGSNTMTFGTQQTTQGAVVLANTAAGAFPVTIQSSNSTSAAWTLTLPTTAGTNGYVLSTNGSGVTSWTAVSSGITIGTTAITSGTTTRVLYDNGGVVGEASSLTIAATTLKVGVVSAPFGLSGNISSTAWTTSGIRYQNSTATLTDTSSSGTVAAAYTDFFGSNTIAASNVTTYTNYYTMYVGSPTAGTNVTFTNSWSLGTAGGMYCGGNAAMAISALGSVNTNQTLALASNNNFSMTLTGNITLSNPTGLTAGQSGIIYITQDGTGGRTMAFGTYWKFPNGGTPTLTTTASAVDAIAYVVRSTTSITAQFIPNIG